MTKDAYSWIARHYDKLFDTMNAGLHHASLKLFSPGKGMAVLDVGCGTGSHLVAYQKAGCEIYGIDKSAAMLQVAQDKLGSDARLHLGDASSMPFENAQFDLISTTLTLHEMNPGVRHAVISEMKRTLKPDGRLLLIDYHPGSLQFPKGWISKVIITMAEIAAGREHFKNYRQFMASDGLPTLISAHQLSIEKQRIVSGGNMALFLLSLETEQTGQS